MVGTGGYMVEVSGPAIEVDGMVTFKNFLLTNFFPMEMPSSNMTNYSPTSPDLNQLYISGVFWSRTVKSHFLL